MSINAPSFITKNELVDEIILSWIINDMLIERYNLTDCDNIILEFTDPYIQQDVC